MLVILLIEEMRPMTTQTPVLFAIEFKKYKKMKSDKKKSAGICDQSPGDLNLYNGTAIPNGRHDSVTLSWGRSSKMSA